MRRVEKIPESVFSLDSSSIDTNRFYSILLDAKAATVSENMCDITEKLLHGEKENAKAALEQLWNLKKSLFSQTSGTLDMVISFYQDKINILRSKEESIKQISKDSRTLLEEKRKRDEELATVKQQIEECTKELQELNTKLNKLKVKEQELVLIDEQIKKELNTNENEIVNGLYEIILSQQERENELRKLHEQNPTMPATSEELLNGYHAVIEDKASELNQTDLIMPPQEQKAEPVPVLNIAEAPETIERVNIDTVEQPPVLQDQLDLPPYPKSVVKTTNGRVIGEYFYDGKVYKNERHYIFHSKFFADRLAGDVKYLRQKFDQAVYSEIMQMIHQAYKRVADNGNFHFEISTNEILNEKTLKQLWQNSKIRNFDEAERFCSRLKAKIEALGGNYKAMLQEQMKRCTGQK